MATDRLALGGQELGDEPLAVGASRDGQGHLNEGHGQHHDGDGGVDRKEHGKEDDGRPRVETRGEQQAHHRLANPADAAEALDDVARTVLGMKRERKVQQVIGESRAQRRLHLDVNRGEDPRPYITGPKEEHGRDPQRAREGQQHVLAVPRDEVLDRKGQGGGGQKAHRLDRQCAQ